MGFKNLFVRIFLLTLLFVFLFLIPVLAQAQEVQAWGDNQYTQNNVPANLSGVLEISAGLGHTMALKYDGTVTVWGWLVPGNAVTNVKSISAGGLHAIALKSDGTVVAWGSNLSGQLNVPSGLANVKAIAAGRSHNLVLKGDGTVVAWGNNSFNQSNVPVGLTDVIAVSASTVFSLALKADGTVVSWGAAASVPSGLTNVIAIDAGQSHALALKSDGTVVAWGDNTYGQSSVPPGLTGVIAVSAGDEHSVALKADGTVVAWGRNQHGQTSVPSGLSGVVEIAAGANNTVVRTAGETRLNVWGSSLSTLTSPSFDISGIKAIAAGRTAGLALNADGTITAWGTGNIVSALPAGLTNVKAVGAGIDHALALKADGTVVSWGSNSFGERDVPSGLTDVKAIAVGAYHNLALKSDGTVVKWGNVAADAGFPTSLSNVTDIAAGSVHSLATLANGTVTGWGNNSSGQISIPGGLANVTDIAGGNQHSLALKADGNVEGWGLDSDDQYNFSPSPVNVKSVAAGQTHSLVLKSDGTLATAGINGVSSSTIPAGLNAVLAIDSRLNNNVAMVADQAPTLSNVANGMNYLEGASALTLQGTLTITDNSHTSLAGATVSITGGFLTGDILAVTTVSGLTATYDQSSGALTISGTSSVANYRSALRSLTYHSTSESPALNATRTINMAVTDGTQQSNTSFTLNVIGVNDAPSFNTIGSLIIGEDAPAVEMNWLSAMSPGPADEAGQTLTIEVENNNNGLFSVQPAINSSGRLSFTLASNANGTANVTVRLIDNGGTANSGVDRTEKNFSILVNAINDAPSFTKGADVVVNEDAGAQTVSGWATGMSAGPANESSQTLSFSVNNDNTSLFSSQPSLDPAGNLTFTPAPDQSGVATVSVTLTDNGGTALGGVNSVTQTFTLTIDPVNDAPSFIKGADVIVNEDAGSQTINGWATDVLAGPADESGQLLTFNAINDNTALFSVQPALNAAGDLTFTPAANATGMATVSVTLNDDGGTANGGADGSVNQTFTITIDPVNDAPSFLKGTDVMINEDAGVQTLVGWANSISPGPADESVQQVTFNVLNNNNSLFSVQPAVSSSGDLTFTPASDAFGAATVTLSLHDNGGTANGGADQSIGQTFTITIDPVNDVPSFTKGVDVAVDEDAPAQVINAWATGISAGAGEGTQTLNFNISNDNTSLFLVQPFVNASGDLTFTPEPDMTGTATVTLSLQDHGGTANGGVDESAAQQFTITINDINDAPSFTKGNDIVVNEDAAFQTFNAWATDIQAGPSNEATQTLDVQVSNDDNSLFSVQPAVSASGDLTFTPAADVFGAATVTLSLHDNGGTANGGVDQSADQTFTITINPVNDAPSFTKGNDITIEEDASAQIINSWATDISAGPGEGTQTLHFNISNDNTSLFLVQPFVNPSGDLIFTPAPDVTGAATVTLSVQDNGGTVNGGVDESADQTFTITIGGVNDAPSFVKGPDIIVNEDAAPYSAAWATGISAGEPGQGLLFIVSVDNPGLFAVQPSINASGVLSFTLQQHAFGSSLVTVHLKDDGGVAQGGVDRSTDQTFTITVNPVNDAPYIDPVSDLTITVNSEPVSFSVAGIHPGVGEDHQQITIESFSDDHSILPDPEITSMENGTAVLTITPAQNVIGTSTVTIRIKDDGGTHSGGEDETIISFMVIVEEEVQAIFLPNFFSPNNNGMNDGFQVRGAGIEQIQFRIYNMDGEELFSTTDITEATGTGWDGKYKGKDQPAGTYVWTLQGKYINGQPLTNNKTKYGQVILMR